jgi:DNA modification methylase
MIKINTIKSNPNNPRVIKDEKFEKLKKSISEFPKMMELRPMVINQDNIVLGGNMRLKALKELGYKEVPDEWVKQAKDLTEEETRRFIIADNVGFGDHDWDMLSNEWNAEELESWGLDIPSFDSDKKLEAEEDDFDTTPPEIPISVLGDLYEIGEHRLLCGDSTDSDQVAKLMNGEKADMVFTDPPYGVSYTGGHNKKQRKGIESDEFKNEDLSNLFQNSINNACIFSKDTSPFYIWYAGGKSKETYAGLSNTSIEVRAVICWYKVKSGSGAFMSQYIPNYEPCIYGFKEGKSINWYGPTDEKTVWEFPKDRQNEFHLTQKPILVVERALKNSSKSNDLIYDCFLGGGSTMVAAHQLKRKCYGMELDPKYCDVIVNRMIKLDETLTVKRNGIDVTNELKKL